MARRVGFLAVGGVAVAGLIAAGLLLARPGGSGPGASAPPARFGESGSLTYWGSEAVRFTSPQVGWHWIHRSIGQRASLVRTTDGGATWTTVLSRTDVVWVTFLDDDNAVAVLQDARTGWAWYATADGGESWRLTPFAPWLTPLGPATLLGTNVASPRDWWVLVYSGEHATELASIWRTTDAGGRWSRVMTGGASDALPLSISVSGVAFRSSTTGWIAARTQNGPILYLTQDGGQTWTPQSLPPVIGLALGIHWEASAPVFPGGGLVGYVGVKGDGSGGVGSEGFLYATHDGGLTWDSCLPLPPLGEWANWWFGGFIDADRGWVASERQLWMTEDGGKSWRSVPRRDDYFTDEFYQLSFVDPSHGFAMVGPGMDDPYAYAETTDGGAGWNYVQLP